MDVEEGNMKNKNNKPKHTENNIEGDFQNIENNDKMDTEEICQSKNVTQNLKETSFQINPKLSKSKYIENNCSKDVFDKILFEYNFRDLNQSSLIYFK